MEKSQTIKLHLDFMWELNRVFLKPNIVVVAVVVVFVVVVVVVNVFVVNVVVVVLLVVIGHIIFCCDQ